MISASLHPSFIAYTWSSRQSSSIQIGSPPQSFAIPLLGGSSLYLPWSRNLWPYLEPVHYIHNYSQGCSLVVNTIRPSSCSVHTLWITPSNVFFHALFRDGVHGKYTYVYISVLTVLTHVVTILLSCLPYSDLPHFFLRTLDVTMTSLWHHPPMTSFLHHYDLIPLHFTPLRCHHQNTINTRWYRSSNLTCSYLVTW